MDVFVRCNTNKAFLLKKIALQCSALEPTLQPASVILGSGLTGILTDSANYQNAEIQDSSGFNHRVYPNDSRVGLDSEAIV